MARVVGTLVGASVGVSVVGITVVGGSVVGFKVGAVVGGKVCTGSGGRVRTGGCRQQGLTLRTQNRNIDWGSSYQ